MAALNPQRHLQRLFGVLLGVPVFVKVMGIALSIAVMLGGGMLWQIHQTWHGHLVAQLDQQGRKLARDVEAQCLELSRAGLDADIPAVLRHALQEAPDVAYLVLQDTNGAVLAEARAPEAAGATLPLREVHASLGQGPHQLRAGLSTARVDRDVAWLTRRLARLTAIITLLGMLAAWALTRIFVHPMEELVVLTRAIKAGDYTARAPVRSNDEVGEVASAFNEMTQAVAQQAAARQQLLRRVIQAGEAERKRVARELHDQTGQALTSLIASLGAMEHQPQDAAMRRRLVDLRQQVEQTLAEVHELSVALRPSVLDDVGLMAALQRHCRVFAQRSGIEVACSDLGLDGTRLPDDVELAVYRVVQEALTNAVRHGQATRASALVELTGASVRATIQDNGRGFDAADWQKRCAQGNHLGLLGIEERVTLLGGSFCVESLPGRGTAVYADIPLKEAP